MCAARFLGEIGHRVDRVSLLVIDGHGERRLVEVKSTVVVVLGKPDEVGLDAVDALAAEQRRGELERQSLAGDIQHDIAPGDVACRECYPGVVVVPALVVGGSELGQFLGCQSQRQNKGGDNGEQYPFHWALVIG